MASVQAQVEELGDNRVRVTVDVPGADVHHAVEHAASDLAQNVRIPGFRKGKVPMPVLISRVGRERLMAEAVESHIGGWFWNAASQKRLRPVAQPEYDFELPASDRGDWRFTATVAVQPKPQLADWTKLEVPRMDAEVPDDVIELELDVLRHAVAELSPAERPAQHGDTVVIDVIGPADEAQRDFVAELGSGRLPDEVETALRGLSLGETREVDLQLAEGANGRIAVTLKEVHEPVLAPLDDELARAASEFETYAELRADVERELQEQFEDEAESAFRAAAVDALVQASNVQAAGALVETRTRELLSGLVRSVEARGISFETYLSLTGTTAEQLVERLRDQARRAVAREIVLETVADDLGLEVSDAEVEAVVREQAEAAGDDPETVLSSLRERGALEQLREDLRLRNALDRIAAEVTPISADLAAARETIWTPDKEKPDVETKLWTPQGKER